MTGKSDEARTSDDLVDRAKRLVPKFSDLDQRTLAAFLDQFGLMLQCGLQPSTALDALSANQPSQKLCAVINDISDRIHSGHTLASAMGRYPDVFPGTVLILVKVGEQSGDLAGQLRRAGEMVQRTDTFVSKVKGAITGPLVTAGFCGFILFLIVKLVFPRFVAMYDSMDIEFPTISKVVLSVVSVVNHPITMVLVVLLVVLGSRIERKFRTLCWIFCLPFHRLVLCSEVCCAPLPARRSLPCTLRGFRCTAL